MASRESGVIISWSDRHGRGVIRRDKGPDVGFSFSAIHQEPEGYIGLAEGYSVTFLLVTTDTGVQAEDVTPDNGDQYLHPLAGCETDTADEPDA